MGSQDFSEIERKIREVLLNDWDPLGVSDIPEAHDEYDYYIAEILHLVQTDVAAKEIAHHLNKIELSKMGVGHHSEEDLIPVAKRLLSLKS